MTAGPARPLRVVRLYDDLLGTHSDGGNALVLAQRARWRGWPAEIVEVRSGDPVPDDGDLYLLAGGPHAPGERVAELLGASDALARAVDRGAPVLAVGVGFAVLGERFDTPTGETRDGLGVLDLTTARVPEPPPAGEVVVETDPSLGAGRLVGWRETAHAVRRGPRVRPLGVILGDGPGPVRHEGAHQGRVVGTDLHGPVLALNPVLADRLLGWASGREPAALDRLDDGAIAAARADRLTVASAAPTRPRTRWWRRPGRRG